MQYDWSGEQEQLRESLRRFLERRSPLAAIRARVESDEGCDPKVWSELAGQLGVHGLAIPEEYGGSGFSFLEQAIVLGELGRTLYDGPFLATVIMAGSALLAAGDTDAAKQWLPSIAAGDLMATVALVDGIHPALPVGRGEVRATPDGKRSYRLSGAASQVVDAAAAQLILVFARGDGTLGLFAVIRDAPGLTIRQRPTLDLTRRLADIDLDGVPAVRVETSEVASAVAESVVNLTIIALAAEQAGLATRALEIVTEYATGRQQFGRPIGSFQAVKHMLADAYLESDAASSAVQWAARAAAVHDDEVPTLAHLVSAFCSDTALSTAAVCVQAAGGIATTWEYDLQMYYKRALTSAQLLGPARLHRSLLADRILADSEEGGRH